MLMFWKFSYTQDWHKDSLKFWTFGRYEEGNTSSAWYYYNNIHLDSISLMGKYYSVSHFASDYLPISTKPHFIKKYNLRFDNKQVFLTDSIAYGTYTKPVWVNISDLKIADFNLNKSDTLEINIPTRGRYVIHVDSFGYYYTSNPDAKFWAQYCHVDSQLYEDGGKKFAIIEDPFAVFELVSQGQYPDATILHNRYSDEHSFNEAGWICYGDSIIAINVNLYPKSFFDSLPACNESDAVSKLNSWIWAGTKDFGNSKFLIYPNPTKNILYFGNCNFTTYYLSDYLGRKLISGKVENPLQTSLDLGEFQPGTYFLFLESISSNVAYKVILEK